ncbi:MAG TPA: helix-turn-helix domain-containing protein [Syntrophaceticus sp.]|jgi:hypothetical protein|uniref:Helix-turn-helix domain-containing protein n=1 Tax=Syntrophaceticus schinkii TaxID=499207 RepID=A0A0B7MBZ4_9FIRM|nr:helix-turn-helix domain-containing protein [Syntrophaceticus schinkii]CEO87580.1 hypothetical protein SSCH_1130008 [Syntrophaceticus schinkii]HHY30963.1 helix-turn-helix domain-containing protein [Syntrophaceticus sp.]
MRSYISNKIEHCKAELMHALDRNDYLSAIKLRAVQKEFEDLLNAFDSAGNTVIDATALSPQQYYTTREAAAVLGVHPSSVTRKAAFLHGQKINGRWQFPKEIIDQEGIKLRGRVKPGRKPQS